MSDPQNMRRDYGADQLRDGALAATWPEQLMDWFQSAVAHREIVEPNAVQLATVSPAGRPSVRTVLAKGITAEGLIFYTNYDSDKGRDLAHTPYAEAVFAWVPMERQVRLAGPVERVSREHTEHYFAGRPRGAQLAAWASPQSRELTSRDELEQAVAELEVRFAGGPVPAPPNWGGYLIRAERVEFWQGRRDRLHDRFRFAREGSTWTVDRLAP